MHVGERPVVRVLLGYLHTLQAERVCDEAIRLLLYHNLEHLHHDSRLDTSNGLEVSEAHRNKAIQQSGSGLAGSIRQLEPVGHAKFQK